MNAENTIKRWLRLNLDHYRDIVLCGRVFGGRHGESPQLPRRYSCDKDVLRLYFATTEVLTVVSFASPFIHADGSLVIPDAHSVTFGWHYYGREQTPGNWCEVTYTRRSGTVHVVMSGPIVPHGPASEIFQYHGDEFVKII